MQMVANFGHICAGESPCIRPPDPYRYGKVVYGIWNEGS